MGKLQKLSCALKSLRLSEAAAMCVEAYHNFNSTLESYTKILAAENELAKLSSWDFVFAFRPDAKAIGEMLPVSNTETYLSLVDQACKMLASGKDQVDVLWHFDMMRHRMMKGE